MCLDVKILNSSTTIITTSLSIIMCVNRKQLLIFYCCKAAKYSLTDSITQHLQENNPLLHDLLSLSQSRELLINSNKK